jgi:CheY-like chemotaxis protein
VSNSDGIVEIAVTDQGVGIPDDEKDRVFERFYRSDPARSRNTGGSGLGLSIVYGIVRDHGGQIWVESERSKGTSFFIRLPARSAGEAAASLGVVLVAQGDASFRDFLGAVFSGWGCSVRIAANTREVLESFAEDQVGLAVLDRSVVEIDSRSWQAAWAPLRGRAALIAVTSSSVVDDATTRVLREEATVVVAVPHDLCMIRRAFNAATGIAP